MTPKALSREIKFRAWGTEYGGGETKMRYSDESPDVPCFWTLYVGNKQEYAEAIMQYTGLHDKNGKEIYEGDFVMFGTTRLEVIWDENRVGFATLDINRKDMGGVQNKKGRFGEIIGNIYENPELLTKENK